MKKVLCILLAIILFGVCAFLIKTYVFDKEEKPVKKSTGKKVVTTTTNKPKEDIMDGITINFHASVRMEKDGKVIYFDPYQITDTLNDADYVFITHSHYDHYSESDIKKVIKDDTKYIVTSDVELKIKAMGVSSDNITTAYPNESYKIDNLKIDAITAYNTNKSFHKKSYNWVGYNVNINGIKYYVVGDSDVTDEMKKVSCDVIFVPVGGTYTMTDKEAAEVVNDIKPKYAVPYHYGVVGSRSNAENFVSYLNSDIKGIILK